MKTNDPRKWVTIRFYSDTEISTIRSEIQGDLPWQFLPYASSGFGRSHVIYGSHITKCPDIENGVMSGFLLKFDNGRLTLAQLIADVELTTDENQPDWFFGICQVGNIPYTTLNSFNDREPICETPEHAINCFLRTKLDYLYFYDYDLLVEKKT